jgi:pilus assembly protein FimV
MTVTSALGQPLRAEIELIAVPKDDIDLLVAKVATVDDYKRAGVEQPEGLQSVRFAVERRAGGQPYLKVTSLQAMGEPFLQLLVQLEWPSGKILRNYTLLLDPPGLQERPAMPAVKAPEVKVEEPAKPITPAEKPKAAEAAVVPSQAEATKQKPSKAPPAAAPKQPEPKKEPEVLVRAEPAKPLTPAEQTFPRFDEEKPAAAPQPAVVPPPAPAPAAAPRAEKSYAVKQGDNLAKIAGEFKPEGYNLDQMLVALFEANKQAFQDGNMNRLKSGQILQIPDAKALDAVSKADAAKEVKAHAADWNAYRQKLAGTVAEEKPGEPAAKQEAAGKITAKVEEKGPKAEQPKDVLKLSKGDVPGEGTGKAAAGKAGAAEVKGLQDKLNAAQEEAAAKDKALKDANSRIGDLEKNIADMQRLLEARNKQLADLQQQASAKPKPEAKQAPAPEAAAPTAPPAAEKPTEAAPAATQPAEAPAEAKPAEEPKPEKPKAKPKAKPHPVEPVREPSFLEEMLSNPLYLAGGGAVAVGGLLAALWAVGRRRKKSLASFEDSIMTAGDLKANTVFGNTGGGQIDTGDTSFLTDFSQGGIGAIDTNDVDPIAEAEVYMAYGRDAQAEEILKEAMSKDPNRHEVQLKLLEIYSGRRNQEAFETIASELYAATGGQGPIWEKAAELGRNLDPANPLYGGDGTGAPPPVVPAAAGAAVIASAAAAAGEAAAEAPTLDFNLDLDAAAGTPLDQATVPGEFAAEMPLDLGFEPETAPAPAVEETSSDATLDFDLGNIIPQAVEKQGDQQAGEEPSLSFELPDLDELARPGGQAASPAEADTLGGLDFQFDLDVPTAASESAPVELAIPDLDLGLDLGESPAKGETVPLEEATTLAGGPGESWEEASTKLDLARAYIEMGDKEGAREILEEVVSEGGPEQQANAKELLASLA